MFIKLNAGRVGRFTVGHAGDRAGNGRGGTAGDDLPPRSRTANRAVIPFKAEQAEGDKLTAKSASANFP